MLTLPFTSRCICLEQVYFLCTAKIYMSVQNHTKHVTMANKMQTTICANLDKKLMTNTSKYNPNAVVKITANIKSQKRSSDGIYLLLWYIFLFKSQTTANMRFAPRFYPLRRSLMIHWRSTIPQCDRSSILAEV
jgi:hypothetical protein